MAQARQERLKELLFFAFLVVSVMLVILVWVEGLRADAQTAPGYYRGSHADEIGAGNDVFDSSPAVPGGRHNSEPALEDEPHPPRHAAPASTPVVIYPDDEDI